MYCLRLLYAFREVVLLGFCKMSSHDDDGMSMDKGSESPDDDLMYYIIFLFFINQTRLCLYHFPFQYILDDTIVVLMI